MSDQPSRWREMASAMQMHLDERRAQAGKLGNQASALMEAAGMGLGEAYGGLTLPARPYDAMTADGPRQSGEALIQDMLLARSPGLEMAAAPTMGMTPEELGIGPSPEWLSQADARLEEMDARRNERAFKKAMQRAAYKLKRQQHSADYSSPEVQAETKRDWQAYHAAKGGS